MIDNEVGRIALATVTRAEFYACTIDGRKHGEDIKQDSIFFELRILPEANVSHAGQPFVALGREETILLHERLLGSSVIL
jgi:hypothetical protein